jgi:hypothetical protein
MIMTNLLKGAAFAAVLGLAAVPAVSPAAVARPNAPIQENYDTSITPIFGFEFPVTGQLQLQVYPNGIVQGYYQPAYDPQFIPVTGGERGNAVWIDIGTMGRIHVDGTVRDGRIVGTAFDQRTMQEFKFDAKRAAG